MVCLPAAVFRGFPSDKGETTGSAQGEGLPYGKQTFGLGHVAQRDLVTSLGDWQGSLGKSVFCCAHTSLYVVINLSSLCSIMHLCKMEM